MFDPIIELARLVGLVIGIALVVLGAIMDLIAAIGMNRFTNFYLRLHAATVGTIGGSVYPLVGLALIALCSDVFPTLTERLYVAGIALVTAFFVALTAPVGSHVLARAAHRSGEAKHVNPEPVVDKLKEDRGE